MQQRTKKGAKGGRQMYLNYGRGGVEVMLSIPPKQVPVEKCAPISKIQ